ncbi:uncharacterized protein BDR25DRAFT_353130 [Lindgomyces ingoldianus]|uniref:Uncharacterized protein n=1 Tax=Lindgomyces ingoldianus TaxID=673940 RepID=A0ACB6R1V3_9PLEO|nr:uncharacterized protein BDR25DRAFT_353130 [Lindgomyces ingoldianus]KAF2472808.1 hypothetical protein BDR25DRAFT_353130 [Lindgomyces ingoldianus]
MHNVVEMELPQVNTDRSHTCNLISIFPHMSSQDKQAQSQGCTVHIRGASGIIPIVPHALKVQWLSAVAAVVASRVAYLVVLQQKPGSTRFFFFPWCSWYLVVGIDGIVCMLRSRSSSTTKCLKRGMLPRWSNLFIPISKSLSVLLIFSILTQEEFFEAIFMSATVEFQFLGRAALQDPFHLASTSVSLPLFDSLSFLIRRCIGISYSRLLDSFSVISPFLSRPTVASNHPRAVKLTGSKKGVV